MAYHQHVTINMSILLLGRNLFLVESIFRPVQDADVRYNVDFIF